MRKILLLVIMASLCTPQLIYAQKIHKIIFAATSTNIGASVKVDNDRAVEEIDAIAGYIGYEVVDYVYNGDDCSRDNLMKVLNGLNCSPQDIVFFYYSGHGIHPKGGLDDKFPQICLKYSYYQEQYFVSARKIEDIIRSKNPRLRIIITDCCNNIDEDGHVSVKGILDGKKGATVVEGNIADNYRRLFVNAKGKVMAISSQLGQTSGCARDKEGNELGGYYSLFFWDVLLKYCEGKNAPTWNDVIATTKAVVSEVTHQKQVPYDVIDVTGENGSITNPGTVPSTPTPGPTPSNATTSDLSRELAQFLTCDTDTRITRINSILQGCFRGDGTVVTVGRNLKTVVEYETATNFLRRIATSKNILRISIIKEEIDKNGKPYITVHEIRKGDK